MRPFERVVQAELKRGTDVFYKVTVQYFGDRVVPYAFKLSAWSIGANGERTTVFENEVVKNEVHRVNLGVQDDSYGQPVPLM